MNTQTNRLCENPAVWPRDACHSSGSCKKHPGVNLSQLSGNNQRRSHHASTPIGCPEANVGDGDCDVFCNNDRCAYDGGDCDGLSQEELAEQRESMCAQGCLLNDVGDRFCDPNCNVAECEYDGGDCTVQPD